MRREDRYSVVGFAELHHVVVFLLLGEKRHLQFVVDLNSVQFFKFAEA